MTIDMLVGALQPRERSCKGSGKSEAINAAGGSLRM